MNLKAVLKSSHLATRLVMCTVILSAGCSWWSGKPPGEAWSQPCGFPPPNGADGIRAQSDLDRNALFDSTVARLRAMHFDVSADRENGSISTALRERPGGRDFNIRLYFSVDGSVVSGRGEVQRRPPRIPDPFEPNAEQPMRSIVNAAFPGAPAFEILYVVMNGVPHTSLTCFSSD